MNMIRRIPLQQASRYGIRFFRTLPSSITLINQTLQHRITEALDRKAHIIPVMEQWRQQNNHVNPSDLRLIIKRLRDSNHSLQALQVSEWMSEEKICYLIPEDYAARFHLIENVLGLEEAEKFFESIPKIARDDFVYTTLLNSYARSDKTLDKAKATFQKMKELRDLGLLSTSSPYNAMISLYSSLKDRDKVEEILREMKDNNVEPNSVTVNNVLKLYTVLSDVAAMEKFWSEWQTNRGIKLELQTAIDMAKAYLRTGLKDKAIRMLRLAEVLVDPKSSKSPYEALMKLYGEVGEKNEVLRVWNFYKKKIDGNEGYLYVIDYLLKVNDIDKAEEIYRAWECSPLDQFDIRIPNMLASSYRERGMIYKAEKLMTDQIIKDRRMNNPVGPLLEEWGNGMKPSDLKCLIKNLCYSNQLSKALQVSEWMFGKRVCNLYSEDYAVRLHLIDNVLGLGEAEEYFEGIPNNMKDYSVYATLLKSYAKSKETLKANTMFKEMRELGFLLKPSPFNSMISLRSQDFTVKEILREMEENKVEPDSLTVNNVLKVYAEISNVEAMETFLSKWRGEEGIKIETSTMVDIAEAYHRAGSLEKAIDMFGNVGGSKGTVNYLWNKYKKGDKVEDVSFWSEDKVEDDGYRSVINALLKLGDVQGAEKIYEEWIPSGKMLDLRIPGLLISRFCAEGNQLKVNELVKSISWKRNRMRLMKVIRAVKTGACVVVLLIVLCVLSIMQHPCYWHCRHYY